MVVLDGGGRRSAEGRPGRRPAISLVGTVGVAFTLAAAAPARAQEAATSRPARHPEAGRSGGDLPPVRVTKGPALPAPMVTSLRRGVRRAVVESRPGAPGRAEPRQRTAGQGRLTCELRQVSIEFESGDFPGSAVAATVTGFAQSFARGPTATAVAQAGRRTGSRATPGPRVAFALLYVHPASSADSLAARGEPTSGAGWRLTLARFRPEAPGGAQEWQELWGGGADAPPPHPCLVEDAWRRVGRR